MRHKFFLVVLLSAILLTFGIISQCTSPDRDQASTQNQTIQENENEQVPELAEYMSILQVYTHKFALAVDAEHRKLARFYFHEIEELSEKIKRDVPEYEGYDIAGLMSSYIDPTVEPIEDAMQANEWQETRSQVQVLVKACNSCHDATAHGFVKITPGFGKNPYNQDFSNSRN